MKVHIKDEGQFIRLVGIKENKILEEIILPAKIDILKWKKCIFDAQIRFRKDTSMPYLSWFDVLGVRYLGHPPFTDHQ